MRKLIYIFLLLASSFAKGQEQLPIYNQYLFGSYFLINPAVAGIDNVWKVQMTHRQQWVGMEDAPSTQSIAGEGQLFNNFKVGGYLFMDKNGYHKQNGYQFAVSYTLKLDNERTSLRRLSLGLAYSGSNKFIDKTDLADINDPVFIVGDYNIFNHNASFGAFLMWDGFYAGLAGSHLLSGGYEQNQTDYTNSFFPRNYNAIVGWKIKQSKDFYIEPSIMLRVIENYDTHLDLNAKFYYVPTYARRINAGYWIGASYRTSWEEFPLNSLSFSAFVGGSYKDFYYGYSYEIMTDKYQGYHTGSHQLMIGYTLSLKADRKCGCTPFSIPVL
jgi:type IX secretion system PorP/SprF family membrane protein